MIRCFLQEEGGTLRRLLPPARTAGLHWSALYQPALLGLWPAELNRPTSCEKPPDRLRNALYETRYIALETEADYAEKIDCKITACRCGSLVQPPGA